VKAKESRDMMYEKQKSTFTLSLPANPHGVGVGGKKTFM
jgi:hypothetical protein